MSTTLSDYDYFLPRELIAQRPLKRREDSRMMVLYRSHRRIEHRHFRELKTFSKPGDLFVLNNTRVLPARRFSDDGAVEFLFLERLSPTSWRCLIKPGRKMRIGATSTLDGICMRVEEITTEGERIVTFDQDLDVYADGLMPLPPYLNRSSDETDAIRYQTVFAREPGAVAAPTAGLHFTSRILNEIPHTFVTLHVGPGTFLPVRSEDIGQHRMHAERFAMSRESEKQINSAQRVIAVGTTVVRVLETAARQSRINTKIVGQPRTVSELLRAGAAPDLQQQPQAGNPNNWQIARESGETDLFIYPPFTFQLVDALLTNFHLPRSTLLMLVSAFAGREFILRAYEEAVRERYRFYSYGDCMLIL
jgi:S-adenosylmethionine:tRNA ribosyltransferase-isomerase